MFGQVLDKLDAWFGRAFVIASYLPSLLFALTNAALAYAAFPIARPPLLALWQNSAADKTIDLFAALSLVGVLAYAVTPLIQIVTNLLEGDGIPAWLSEVLVMDESVRQEREALRQRARSVEHAALPRRDVLETRLRDARAAGAQLRSIGDPAVIAQATQLMDALHRAFYLRRPISRAELDAAVAALEQALRFNCADRDDLPQEISQADAQARQALDQAHKWCTQVLLPYARSIVTERWLRDVSDPYNRGGQPRLKPTYLGNEADSLRRYCYDRYGIDFDSFWPLFQLAVKDAGFKSAIATSKTQLDFAVLMFALSVVTVVGWTLLLGLYAGDDVWLFASVVVLGTIVCRYALSVVQWSYASFASVVRSTIDMARFDVMDQLRLSLPASLHQEVPVWRQIARWLVAHETPDDITYKHPGKP